MPGPPSYANMPLAAGAGMPPPGRPAATSADPAVVEAGTVRLRAGAVGVPVCWQAACARRQLAFALPFVYSGQGAVDRLWSERLRVEYPGGVDLQV